MNNFYSTVFIQYYVDIVFRFSITNRLKVIVFIVIMVTPYICCGEIPIELAV